MSKREIMFPRKTLVDVYPRDADPNRPDLPPGIPPYGQAPGQSAGGGFPNWLRVPRTRGAPVYRRFISYELVVGVTPVPLLGQVAEAETIVVQVTSAAANPVFGGNQAVTPTNGRRINPGQAWVLEEDNRRYDQEVVQAVQELTQVAAVGLDVAGLVPPEAYYNPRVVLNPNDFFVVTAIQRPVTVTLFYPPERV